MGLFGFFKKKQEESVAPFKERRMLPRWQISVKAKIKWDGQNDYVDCQVRNLNMRGFSVLSPVKIPQDCLHFTLYFNEQFFFNVDIAILWSQESEGQNTYGAKFTRIKDDDKEKICQMMRQNFPQYLCKY